MKTTKQSRRDAKQLFRSTFVNGVMDTNKVRAVVTGTISAKPRGYLAILEHFKRFVKLEEDRRSAKIESPVAIPPEQQTNLQATLTRIYGPGLNIAFVENPALIGGLRIKVGSDVYDGSVQSRLQQLAETF
jgi:F-type H+-transporting ATPase subunit delta